MEGWVKIGVQRASVLYPNSCYNEPCYIEVQVYSGTRDSSTTGLEPVTSPYLPTPTRQENEAIIIRDRTKTSYLSFTVIPQL